MKWQKRGGLDPFDSAWDQQSKSLPGADSWASLPAVGPGLGSHFPADPHPGLVERASPSRRASIAQVSQSNTHRVPGEVDGVQWPICWKDTGTE